MDVKQSLENKLLYHFQNDPEWMEFFNALLDSADWSIFDHAHYEDSEVGQMKIYNNTDYLHAATETGFADKADGGTSANPTGTPLEGGSATTPSESLETQDAWSSILILNLPFSVGKRYSIVKSSPSNAANFYYNGVRSQSFVYSGGNVYMERWDLNWVILAVEGDEGFNLTYKDNDFPLLFSPGSFFDLKYAYALYKKTVNAKYTYSAEKVQSYTDHWLHSPKFLDLQTIYIPNLRFCFPEYPSFTDKLYKGMWDSGSAIAPTDCYTDGDPEDLIGEVYSYNHGIITLKEPCSNFTLEQLQEYQDGIIYRRQYQYTVASGVGTGYVPTVLPNSVRANIQATRRFLAKFTTESVAARINIPVNFNS